MNCEDDELNYMITADFIRVVLQKVDTSKRNGDNNSKNDNEAITYFPFYFSSFISSFIAFK